MGATWVVRPNGEAWAWGYVRQIDGDFLGKPRPARVAGLSDVVTARQFDNFACANFRDGAAACWGYTHGGDAVPNLAVNPSLRALERFKDLSDVEQIQGRYRYACAKSRRGEVSCWGTRLDGATDARPRLVPKLGLVTRMSVGNSAGCAVRGDGSLACWGLAHGRNWSFGAALEGHDDSVRDSAYPVDVKEAIAVDAHTRGHACAVTRAGEVWCWGSAGAGQLGHGGRGKGPAQAEFSPVRVSGLSDAVDVATMESISCALRRDGTVVCWGRNANGELGAGLIDPFRLEPVPVSGLDEVVRLVPDCKGMCALRKDDSVHCWPRGPSRRVARETAFSSIPPVDAPSSNAAGGAPGQ